MNCKNCNTEVNYKFCQECGHPKSQERINGKYIIHQIEHVIHFERGILYTIKELILNPGQNVNNYLTENRSRLVKPIIFIVLTSLIYTLTINFFHINDSYIKFDGGKLTTSIKIFKWIEGHYGYANVLISVFIAFWLKLFFRKSDFNIFEIMILLCFVTGIAMLIFTLFALIQGLTHANLMAIGGMAGVGYCTWAIGQFFNKSKITNYIKALFAYLLGLLTFSVIAVYGGILIDWFIKR